MRYKGIEGSLDHRERKEFIGGQVFYFDETKLPAKTHQKWARNFESFLIQQFPSFNMIEAALGKTLLTNKKLSDNEKEARLEKASAMLQSGFIVMSGGVKPEGTKLPSISNKKCFIW